MKNIIKRTLSLVRCFIFGDPIRINREHPDSSLTAEEFMKKDCERVFNRERQRFVEQCSQKSPWMDYLTERTKAAPETNDFIDSLNVKKKKKRKKRTKTKKKRSK